MSTARGARWTPSEHAQARELREQGVDCKRIAAALGRNHAVVRQVMSYYGIQRRPAGRPYSAAEAATVRSMRWGGADYADIAAALPGRSTHSVATWCRAHGVRRPRVAPAPLPAVTRTCLRCQRTFTSRRVVHRRCAGCRQTTSAAAGIHGA